MIIMYSYKILGWGPATGDSPCSKQDVIIVHPPPENDHSGPLGFLHMFNDITGIPVWVQIAVLGILMSILLCGCRKRGCCPCGGRRGNASESTHSRGLWRCLWRKFRGNRDRGGEQGGWIENAPSPPPPMPYPG